MPGLHSFRWLALGTLLLAACGEDSTPTQPGSPVAPSAAAPSAAVAALAANTWTPRAPLPHVQGGFAVTAAPNSAGRWTVYTFGGENPEESCDHRIGLSYDLATNAWSALSAVQLRVWNLNGAARIGGRLYFSGGEFHCDDQSLTYNSAWAYVPGTQRLLQLADMPRAIKYGTSGAIGGKLYVLAGWCTGEADSPGHCVTSSAVRQFYRYDPATNTWAFRAQPPHFHTFGASGVIGDKLYVVGDWNKGRDLDVYDPATNTWRTMAPYPVGHQRYFAAVLGSQLYVIGWTSPNTMTAYAYNPATNTWRRRATPPAPGEFVRVEVNGQPRLFLPGNAASYLYTP